MIIDLLPVFGGDGKEIKVETSIDFSSKDEYGIKFLSPTMVTGKILNIGGQLEFSGDVEAKLSFMCDRCNEWFEEKLNFSFAEVLKKEIDKALEGDENPDVIFYEGNRLDISEIIYNNIILNLPTKKLCKEDCKGLCTVCGTNLNEKDCGCKEDNTDPRFDVLDKFFN